jgi:D-beta-D-heptose 7-phosphate kinase/D-beta-D-heptose 1-phosphate adenosyltransferase
MKKIFVNGSFDILHVGHVRLLAYAKSLGASLLVAIDTDRRIKELKGSTRPINSQSERIEMLTSFRSVDQVKTFDSDDELINIIKNYEPDIMVKGSDYKGQPIIGSDYCKEIVFFDRIDEYSTTKKIQDIIDR